MTSIEENLRQAFTEASRSHHTYLAYADTAEQEGYPQVARLFRAAAQGKGIHARNYLRDLALVGTTADNLREALAGTTGAAPDWSDRRLASIPAGGEEGTPVSFRYAREGEKLLAALFEDALDSLGELTRIDLFVCSVCGATVSGTAPAVCPVCQTPKKFFSRVA